MYKRFFELESNPFSGNPDPRFLHMMPHTREALAALRYGITTRKGFIVLTGEVGTGKTTLLRQVLNSFDPERFLTAFVFNPLLDFTDFLEFVLYDFGLVPIARTKSGMLIQLNRWLIERFQQGQTCVVVIDEAQNLSWELLEEIRLLTNLETSSEKLLQIVLSGQPELEARLKHDHVRQVRQRIALWCHTQALTSQQTVSYVEERLKIAGARHGVFTEDAIVLIHRASAGIPRIINLICEHSMILAYVEELRHIPAALVGAVIQDLDISSLTFTEPSTTDDRYDNFHDLEPRQFSSDLTVERLPIWTEGRRRD